jgi:hypothetical protein
MTIDIKEQRNLFEQWISQPPYERSISRWEADRKRAWPGQYKNYDVQLAWEAWQRALVSTSNREPEVIR